MPCGLRYLTQRPAQRRRLHGAPGDGAIRWSGIVRRTHGAGGCILAAFGQTRSREAGGLPRARSRPSQSPLSTDLFHLAPSIRYPLVPLRLRSARNSRFVAASCECGFWPLEICAFLRPHASRCLRRHAARGVASPRPASARCYAAPGGVPRARSGPSQSPLCCGLVRLVACAGSPGRRGWIDARDSSAEVQRLNRSDESAKP